MAIKNRLTTLVLLLILLFCSLCLLAQTKSKNSLTDEQLIRNINAGENTGEKLMKYTENFIFTSPDFTLPQIGKPQSEQEKKLLAEAKKGRLNEVVKRTIDRLVIAAAKDMAYQYGRLSVDYDIANYDNPNKQHIHYDGSYLLIWRKVSGEWMVEATADRYNQKQ